jgi:dTDP-4-amino-4,6-dideoxygalactose transaminase
MTSKRQIPLLDLRAQHANLREEVLSEVIEVIDSQQFILGKHVERLEAEIADYCGCKFAVGCASGSDALLLAMLAAGIGQGDEVLTTPYTFFATAGAISQVGANPVFMDVEPGTFNMDMNHLEDVLGKHPRIRAVIPVHLFGGCSEMDRLCAATEKRNLLVIEDAAQAIGAEYKHRRAGGLGSIGCFSFFPSKNLGTYGDGGMLTTNDSELRKRLAALRVHGSVEKYYYEWIGINSRLDALQAAVLRVKLRHLDSWTERRQQNADRYRQLLAQFEVPVTWPSAAPYQTRHVYNQFVISADRRDQLRAHLHSHGVGTEVYYPLPLHLQTCFADLGYKKVDFPVSELLAERSLALPVHPDVTATDIEYVCSTVKAFYS